MHFNRVSIMARVAITTQTVVQTLCVIALRVGKVRRVKTVFKRTARRAAVYQQHVQSVRKRLSLTMDHAVRFLRQHIKTSKKLCVLIFLDKCSEGYKESSTGTCTKASGNRSRDNDDGKE